jgi:hypothetical protein
MEDGGAGDNSDVNASDLLRLVLLVLWLSLGSYFLVASTELAARPRRGTALRPPKRAYQVLGLLFVLLALGQAVLLATG